MPIGRHGAAVLANNIQSQPAMLTGNSSSPAANNSVGRIWARLSAAFPPMRDAIVS
jgi:hypothetical protein